MKVVRILLIVAAVVAMFALKGLRVSRQIQRNYAIENRYNGGGSYNSSSSYNTNAKKIEIAICAQKVDDLAERVNSRIQKYNDVIRDSNSEYSDLEEVRESLTNCLNQYEKAVKKLKKMCSDSDITKDCNTRLDEISQIRDEMGSMS